MIKINNCNYQKNKKIKKLLKIKNKIKEILILNKFSWVMMILNQKVNQFLLKHHLNYYKINNSNQNLHPNNNYNNNNKQKISNNLIMIITLIHLIKRVPKIYKIIR